MQLTNITVYDIVTVRTVNANVTDNQAALLHNSSLSGPAESFGRGLRPVSYTHLFYEASSIRKINGYYYFIYSSENSNELCYAVSRYPDRDFIYGGTIISNGDVGYKGLKKEDRTNMTANDHGSLACINGQWYIFHHRHTPVSYTHLDVYKRQGRVAFAGGLQGPGGTAAL